MTKKVSSAALKDAQRLCESLAKVPAEEREKTIAYMNVYMDGFLAGQGLKEAGKDEAENLASAVLAG